MFAIAPTDLQWFDNLRDGPPVGDAVNFWTPTPWGVKGLNPGDRLYFMLKSPIRKIGGYGAFVRYSDMTAEDAWTAYGLGNGVQSRDELVEKINRFAVKRAKDYIASTNPLIGCIELTGVVTLDDDQFLVPETYGHEFPRQIVKLKYFSDTDRMASQLGAMNAGAEDFTLVSGTSVATLSRRKLRKAQALFRQQVLKNYSHKCCVFREHVTELLEAAHIQPYVDERSNHPQNGLCLRVDLHRLFDEGLMMLTSDFLVRVSSRLNGTSYAALDGQSISLPGNRAHWPSQVAIKTHQRSFRA